MSENNDGVHGAAAKLLGCMIMAAGGLFAIFCGRCAVLSLAEVVHLRETTVLNYDGVGLFSFLVGAGFFALGLYICRIGYRIVRNR